MTEPWGPKKPHPLSQMKTELVWEGKYDEYGNRREVEIAGADLPLQPVEVIDEPRQAAEGGGQDAFDFYKRKSKRQDDFRNMLIWGDNKLVMAALLKDFKGKIDLIYIDPPFDIGADFTMKVPVGEETETTPKDQSILEMIAYRDMWGKGTDSYLHMMYERMCLMREFLSEKGSIWVHCDEGVSALLKLLLDEVFGAGQFQSVVSWRRTFAGKTVGRKIPANVDNIYWYAKTPSFEFHPIRKPLGDEDIAAFTHDDGDGRGKYMTVALQKVSGPTPGTAYDYVDNRGRVWKCPAKGWRMIEPKLRALENDNRLYFSKATIREKYYLNERMEIGKQVDNFWGDIGNINRNKNEDVGYNTQKPEAILERILAACSSGSDLIADFFCGSGTTGSVAEKLGRRWIMADLGRFAIHTSRKRLIGVQRQLYAEGKPYRAFDVYNLGRYERQWWQRERLQGADGEHRKIVLAFYRAEALTGASSPLLHGRKGSSLVHVDSIDSILTLAELKPIVEATASAGAKEIHCLAWEFEMELKRNAEALEHEFKVTVRLVRIPREVMEKNRRPGVDAVPFFEMATLDAEPVVRIEGGERVVDVKLVNFLPSLSEVPSKELEALKERAVKSGFDFIDFWAVDFDHQDGQPFKHHWQDYRLRKDRSLKLASDFAYRYADTKAHTICVKVIDVFGCDTSIQLEVSGANAKRGAKR